MTKLNVLFLCTGNSCRSLMAEALLRARYGDWFDAYRPGTEPRVVHPFTLQVLDEIGIDTSEFASRSRSKNTWENCALFGDRVPTIGEKLSAGFSGHGPAGQFGALTTLPHLQVRRLNDSISSERSATRWLPP